MFCLLVRLFLSPPPPSLGFSQYPLIMRHSTSRTSYLIPHTSSASLSCIALPVLYMVTNHSDKKCIFLFARVQNQTARQTRDFFSTAFNNRKNEDRQGPSCHHFQREHQAREKLRYEDPNRRMAWHPGPAYYTYVSTVT